MSRWSEEFKNLESFKLIDEIIQLCDSIVENGLVSLDSLGELNRTKSVLIYTKDVFSSYAPEFAPIGVIQSFMNQLPQIKALLEDFEKNHELSLLHSSTPNSVDFHVNPILNSALIYSNNEQQIMKQEIISMTQFEKNRNDFLELISKLSAKSIESNDALQELITRATNLNEIFFGVASDQESIKNSINNKINIFYEQTSKHFEATQKYFNELFEENNGVESIKSKIQTFQINAKKDVEEINRLLQNVQNETKELKSFYTEVYGSGEEQSGLKSDIYSMEDKLKKYDTAQKEAHKTLLDKANELLSLTTTIGLSKAFNSLKSSFFKANLFWNFIFIASICGMLFLAKGMFPNEIKHNENNSTNSSVQQSLVKNEENLLLNILLNFSKELPFYIPLAWLAVFASRRRSENKRLEQEYAHKEAVAITYDSYKKQIELIGDEHNKEMLLKLLDKAIETVTYNASTTLDDPKHKESMPTQELLQDVVKATKELIPKLK